ncbi:MAG: hypothetical protein HQL08_13420, partial [Nitrospirae bacterium]|nr:hypothetical protein [Nitrospirota bacterium]
MKSKLILFVRLFVVMSCLLTTFGVTTDIPGKQNKSIVAGLLLEFKGTMIADFLSSGGMAFAECSTCESGSLHAATSNSCYNIGCSSGYTCITDCSTTSACYYCKANTSTSTSTTTTSTTTSTSTSASTTTVATTTATTTTATTSTTIPATSMSSYCYTPPFVSTAVPPLIMLVMSKSHKLFFNAYDDVVDLDGDGIPDVTYKDTIQYTGYFDSNKCYNYVSANNRFEPSGAATGTNSHYCSGNWSGNFLNWSTMARIDILRAVLYGG